MNDTQQDSQQLDAQFDRPSCSYSTAINEKNPVPKGIMMSTPKMDKFVTKILQQPDSEQVQATTLDDSPTDYFPVQLPLKQIEVVYLDSTESTGNIGD